MPVHWSGLRNDLLRANASTAHPGAGSGYPVDTYTINHRAAGTTGDFTQSTAAESPATVDGLTNTTTYDIFVTATNTAGTSAPSTAELAVVVLRDR